MKLRTAVAIFVVLVLGLFVALSLSLVRISSLLDRSARDLAMAGEQIRMAEELKSGILIHNRNAFLHELYGEPESRAARRAQRLAIVRLLETMATLSNTREEDAIVTEVAREIEEYVERRRELSASTLSATEHYTGISQDMDQAISAVDQLIDLSGLQMRNLVAGINSRKQMANFTALVLLSLGGIILLGLIAAIFVFAARPLAQLAQAVASYGAGDNSVRADTRGLQEIRDIASNFNTMAERLEQRRQEQLHFIASIAHDLRNPLHSIALASELLVHKNIGEEQHMARVVLRQVKSLDRLVQDLLDTSHIEAGRLELELAEHDLSAVIRDAAELHRSSTQLHDIQLALPSEPILCHYDRNRLFQVLNNLLSNAIKYSPNGGRVRVEASKDREQIRVFVADEGIGISSEDLSNIFKPFHRTAVTRETIPGIGLGLSASRRIVEAHGGVLIVESELGKGSTFHVIFPCGGQPPPAATEEPIASANM